LTSNASTAQRAAHAPMLLGGRQAAKKRLPQNTYNGRK
jgi:hypothetical protein